MCHGYLLRVREMWGRAYYCFRFIVVGFNPTGATKRVLASRLGTYLSLPSKCRTAQSEHSLLLRRNIKHALKTRGATNCHTSLRHPVSRAWVKAETYHTPKDLPQPNKRVKTPRNTNHPPYPLLPVGISPVMRKTNYTVN